MYTLTLTPQEAEMVYFALNDYSLKYIHASRTWGNPQVYGKDYAQEKAEAICALQVRVGDEIFFETNNNTVK